MSYIDEGSGEPFLICHGITGGYDQGFDVMGGRTDDYRFLFLSFILRMISWLILIRRCIPKDM